MKDLFDLLFGRYFPEGASAEKHSDIMNFISEKLYNEYNEYYMNRELVIKNRVDSLNISLPNAKVGEEYSQLVKIEDIDVYEYWLEGLNGTGLHTELEIILNSQEDVCEANCTGGDGVENTTPNSDGMVCNTSEQENSIIIGTPSRGIVIKGIPSVAGDYDIILKYKYKDWYEGCNILERNSKLPLIQTPVHFGKTYRQTKISSFSKKIIYANISPYQKMKTAPKKISLQRVNVGVPMPTKVKHVMTILNYSIIMKMVGTLWLSLMALVLQNIQEKVLL